MADLTKIEEHVPEADWDDPLKEVGGDLIDTRVPHDPECTADCCSDEYSEDDSEDEECEQDHLCYECDQPHEDCQCETDECEKCGHGAWICECEESRSETDLTDETPDHECYGASEHCPDDNEVEDNPFGER